MTSLDGKPLVNSLNHQLAAQVADCQRRGTTPALGVVMATDDSGAKWYVRSLQTAADKLGVAMAVHDLGARASSDVLAETLTQAAADPSLHGLLLQTPLPDGVQLDDLLSLIPVSKDVDGASPLSAGRLLAGLPAYVPATAAAVMALLEHYQIELTGRQAVVVGRSRVVGKPVALLMLAANATVTVCHSQTANLSDVTRQADIVVVAAGRPGLIGQDHIKAGATVIDVGTTPDASGQLVGDVDPSVGEIANLTPVPGGVGPVTTALILQHTVAAAKSQFSA